MWRSDTSEQYRVYEFTDEFVVDVLTWACNTPNADFTEKINTENMSDKLIKMVSDKRFKRFREEMISLSNCKDIQDVKQLFLLFKEKYKEIIQGQVKLPFSLDEKIIEQIKKPFDYYYKQLIDNESFWGIYNPEVKFVSKKKVREVISKNRVCPYCDQVQIESSTKTNMDHYLPVSVFPYLGVHWRNFVISCGICNGLSQKNSQYYLPILHPHYDEIENKLKFSFDFANETATVQVDDTENTIKSHNYLKLFDFNQLYKGTWEELNDEYDMIELSILKMYHKDKGNIEIVKCNEIIDESINFRKEEHRKSAGTRTYTKMKYDYCSTYDDRSEIISWLMNEQRTR